MSTQPPRVGALAFSYVVLALAHLSVMGMLASVSWAGSIDSLFDLVQGLGGALVELLVVSLVLVFIALGVYRYWLLSERLKSLVLLLSLAVAAASLVGLVRAVAYALTASPEVPYGKLLGIRLIQFVTYAVCAHGVWRLWRQRLTKRWSGP